MCKPCARYYFGLTYEQCPCSLRRKRRPCCGCWPYAPTQTAEGEDVVTEAECKRNGWHIPSKKLRVVLISEDTLHQILDEPLPTPSFERPTDHPRWICLRDMARLQRVCSSTFPPNVLHIAALAMCAAPHLTERRWRSSDARAHH